MGFEKAVKSKSKLRASLFGPSGSGKTFTALSIASGMGQKIALIDSERGSASKYADRFSFDVIDLEEKTIDEYVKWIHEAGNLGYDVLIIDSLSHAWQELLADVDKLAKAKYRGNSWSAWSEGTPKQRLLIDAILSFPGHVMATMRSKTEWETTKDDRGKSTPNRVGLSPEQGKGIEYEFDLLLELSTDHIANVIKDRTGKFQDKLYTKPGKELGEELIAWLNTGVEPVKAAPTPKAPDVPSAGKKTAIGNKDVSDPTPEAPDAPPEEKAPMSLSDELAAAMTMTVGALSVFSEDERSVYRTKYDEAKEKHDVGALKMLVSGANMTVERVRKEWVADGSPMPRVLKSKVAKPAPADDEGLF